MLRKGINFKHAPHLTFRHPRPGDVDDTGRQVEGMYVIIVRVKDCLDEEGNFSHELKKEAPQHARLSYSRTNMGYGEYRKMNRAKFFSLGGGNTHFAKEYWSCPVYWVENGQVFRASSTTWKEPACAS